MRTGGLRVGDYIRVRGKVPLVKPNGVYLNPLPPQRTMLVESILDHKFAIMARDIETGKLEEVDCIDIA